jgi:flagellar biosynthesis protein
MDKDNRTLLQEAVAIRYDRDRENAPRVVAKGKGFVAEQLLAIARRHAVPVYQNQTVTQLLMAVELDREIPPELYQAVANVLAYVYRMDGRAAERMKARR